MWLLIKWYSLLSTCKSNKVKTKQNYQNGCRIFRSLSLSLSCMQAKRATEECLRETESISPMSHILHLANNTQSIAPCWICTTLNDIPVHLFHMFIWIYGVVVAYSMILSVIQYRVLPSEFIVLKSLTRGFSFAPSIGIVLYPSCISNYNKLWSSQTIRKAFCPFPAIRL